MHASAPRRVMPWFDHVPQAAAVIAAAVGALVLIGWAFGVETLKSVNPGLTAMKANAAVSFILSGFALFTAASGRAGRSLRIAAQAASGMVLLLGLLTLWESTTGADLGIDQLLFRDPTRLPGDIPGRMASTSALAFSALGAALLLPNLGKERLVGAIHALAAVPMILGGATLLAYIYDLDELLRARLLHTPMSLHAAVAFVLLAFGAMTVRADYPFRRFASTANPAGVMARRLLPTAILFTLLNGWIAGRAVDASYMSAAAGLAALSAAMIAGLAAMILWSARTLYNEAVQRERTEEALRENEDRLNAVVNLLPVGLWVMGPDGAVTFSNAAAQRIWAGVRYVGINHLGEYKGWRVKDGGLVGAQEWAGARAVTRGETTLEEEIEIECFDGTRKIILDSAVPLRRPDGSIRGAVTVNQDITARKRAEEAARLQAGQYATLLAATTDGFWRFTPDGRLLDVNDAYCRMSGYAREELLTMSVPQIEAVESPEEVARHVRHVLETGFDRFESRHRRKNGEVWDVEISVSHWREAGQLMLFARDITERKQVEAVNAVRLRLMAYAITHSLDELLEETLNEAERLTGSLIGFYHFVEEDQNSLTLQAWSTRTKAEFCRAEGTGLHYPIDEAGVWADSARAGRPVIHNDYASLPNRKGMPEGHARVIREAVVPVRRGPRLSAILGVGNKPTDYTKADVELLLMIADLTGEIAARKRAEEALRKSLEEIEDLYNRAPNGYHSVDKDGTVVRINDTELSWLGYARDEIVGRKNFADLLTPQSMETFRATFPSTKARGYVTGLEYEMVRKDGTILPVLLSATAVRDADGNFLMSRSTIYDITERRDFEARIRRAAAYTRSLIEANPDPLVTISADGKITDLNQATARATGVAREQLLGSDFFDYFTEPDKARAIYQEVFAKGFVADYPLALRSASGDVFDVLYNASIYHDEKGEVTGVVAAARDVTRLRRAEHLTQERVKELRAFYHFSELAARRDFTVESLCEEMVQVLPTSWQYPEITCARIALGEREFRTDNFAASEWMLVAPIKVLGATVGKVEVGYLQPRPPEAEGPFFLEERQVIDAIAERIGQIAELKRAEEALRSSEELFRALATATSEGMLIHDRGRIVEVNRQMEDILRRPRAELIGTAILDLVAPATRERVAERVEQTRDERLEFAFVQPDGSEVYVSGLARDCVYQGRPMRVAAYRDITLEKRAEEAMRTAGLYNRTLLEVSLDPLVTINADGKIADVNEATVQATGVPRSVLLGSDFSDYFTEPDKARAGYQEAFAKGFVKDYPLSMRNVSGRVTEVLYNASVYRNAKGDVVGLFATARDITERRKLELELERQAHIDLLTDLNNRRHFMETAEQELARARRHNEPLSLLMLDVDHFKRVNDTYGHQAGDMALQKLADVCRSTFREMDVVGRLGGEEFSALLPVTRIDQAAEVAERLREAVERASVNLEDGNVLHFTISIGVTRVDAADANITTALKRADAAMYQAKSGGRNRVCLSEPAA